MIRPTMLTVDYDPQPLGLDNTCPGFSWAVTSEERDQVQSAYQILVASCREGLDAGTGDVWNTGKVVSNRTAVIEYDGKPLQSIARYFWKVRVWDGAGIPSESDPAWFNMGLLQPDDWRAKWIGSGPTDEVKPDVAQCPTLTQAEKIHGPIAVDDRSTILRREWTIDRAVRRAMLYVCGLGYYCAWINGERVGDYVLTPSKSAYNKRVLYDAYDVTEMLRKGDNAIGVMLGNGWFDVVKKYWRWQMQWYGTKRAILQMHLDYEDGSRDLLVSDGAWKRAPGPVLDHCIYDGETYDANEEIPGWNRPGCDDSGWDSANEVEPPGGRLAYHSLEPIKVTDTVRPIAMWESTPGAWIFDMGQNFSGWCRITMSGPKGTEVSLHYGENIHPDATLNDSTNSVARATDTYILRGDAEETYEPHFTYHGFRYVEVTGFPGAPALDSIEGRVINSACRQTGEFRCGNDVVNHIHHCTVWSQRCNMMGMPTDCNQRPERLGWLGDVHVTAEECMCNYDVPRFYRKWLDDIKYDQIQETGELPHIAPWEDVSSTPAWSSAYHLVAWYAYEHYGDRRFLTEHFDGMKAYVDYLGAAATDHIVPADRYGDHCQARSYDAMGKPVLTGTFYYLYDAMLVARMAEILGKESEAEKYGALAADIRDAFNREYYDAENRFYGDHTQCEMSMGLFLDLPPEEDRKQVLQRLVWNVMNTRQGHLTTGILGSKYVMDVMARLGRPDVGYHVATQTTFPSWGYMTDGYTTLWETWSRGGSNSHVMFGSVDAWFYKVLAGIQPLPECPGYEKVRIQPYFPEDLSWVRGAIHTVRGRIASAWRKEKGRVHLDVTIPANVSAEVRVPGEIVRDGRVTEGDTSFWDNGFVDGVEGIRAAAEEDGMLTFDVGSGCYRFAFELTPADG